ncbi:MAG: ureidoglycolate lyase [Dongiaceae bacterium]
MATTSVLRLRPVPLTRDLFAPFGDVIETRGHPHYTINSGYAERYSDLAQIDIGERDGRVRVNIFHARERDLPMPIRMVERHPLSSQMFVSLAGEPFLVVVARPGHQPGPKDLHAFVTDGGQGVNYARGTWHHPLIAYGSASDFLVIDRSGPGRNVDEIVFGDDEIMLEPPAS